MDGFEAIWIAFFFPPPPSTPAYRSVWRSARILPRAAFDHVDVKLLRKNLTFLESDVTNAAFSHLKFTPLTLTHSYTGYTHRFSHNSSLTRSTSAIHTLTVLDALMYTVYTHILKQSLLFHQSFTSHTQTYSCTQFTHNLSLIHSISHSHT